MLPGTDSVGGQYLYLTSQEIQKQSTYNEAWYRNTTSGDHGDHAVQRLATMGSCQTSQRDTYQQRYDNGKSTYSCRYRELGYYNRSNGSSSLLQTLSEITVQSIFHIRQILLGQRLVQSIFCLQGCLCSRAYCFLREERTTGDHVHQEKGECCYCKNRDQRQTDTFCNIFKHLFNSLLFFCLRTFIKYTFRICMQVYTYVKCTLLFRQRLLLYYNTFSRLSTELHMKHLPVSVFFLFLIYLHRVRVLRTFVCIFMKKFFNKNSLCFQFLYIVYIFQYMMYIYTLYFCSFFFLPCMSL